MIFNNDWLELLVGSMKLSAAVQLLWRKQKKTNKGYKSEGYADEGSQIPTANWVSAIRMTDHCKTSESY